MSSDKVDIKDNLGTILNIIKKVLHLWFRLNAYLLDKIFRFSFWISDWLLEKTDS